jgi:hypothetical protein
VWRARFGMWAQDIKSVAQLRHNAEIQNGISSGEFD